MDELIMGNTFPTLESVAYNTKVLADGLKTLQEGLSDLKKVKLYVGSELYMQQPYPQIVALTTTTYLPHPHSLLLVVDSKFNFLGLGFVILPATQQNSQNLVSTLFNVFYEYKIIHDIS